MDKLLDLIKKNKIIVIILAAFLLIVVGLLIFSRIWQKNEQPTIGYIDVLSQLSGENMLIGEAEIIVGDRPIIANVSKNGNNFVLSINVPSTNTKYDSLICSQDGTLLLNMSDIEQSSPIFTIKQNEGEFPRLLPTVLSGIFAKAQLTYGNADGVMSFSTENTEEWKSFFHAAQTTLTENKDAILQGYRDQDAMSDFINTLIADCQRAEITETIANTISSTLSVETEGEKKYVGTIDFVADFSALPSFVKVEDFDTNQFKVSVSFTFTTRENTTAKPVGSMATATSDSIKNFVEGFWKNTFAKRPYIPLNEVTVTNTSVSCKYYLGALTEQADYAFDADGFTSAKYYIRSNDATLIQAYKNKYADESSKNFTLIEEIGGGYLLEIVASKSALESLNKIATNPKDFGDYLRTSKGGDIIV